MSTKQIFLDEKASLRGELQHLKQCQLRYFTLSITVTGVIFGVGAKIEPMESAVFLAPLVVVVPCWIIFFDKAKTISRIVGYYRVLEKMVNGNSHHYYRGWETSLGEFRHWQEKKWLEFNSEYSEPSASRWQRMLLLNMPHRYWVINWYTYFSLSALSLILSRIEASEIADSLFLLSLPVVIIAFALTLQLLMKLVYGSSSYSANEQYWDKILSVHETEYRLAFVGPIQPRTPGKAVVFRRQ